MGILYIWKMDNSAGKYKKFGKVIWCGSIFPDALDPRDYSMHSSEAALIKAIKKRWEYSEIRYRPTVKCH